MSLEEAIRIVIERHRVIRKITQEQLAFSCNIDRTDIGRIERAEVKVTVSVIYKIYTALEITIIIFLKEVDELMQYA